MRNALRVARDGMSRVGSLGMRGTGERIFFMHVPKCGGTSLDTAIARTYGPIRNLAGGVFRVDSFATSRAAELRGVPTLEYRDAILTYAMALPAHRYISGHVLLSSRTHEAFRGTWNYVTVLREPVARWFSAYYYNRYKTHSDHQRIDLDLAEFLATDRARHIGKHYVRYFGTSDAGSEEVVDSAVENLRKFAVVGFLEDLGAFAERFRSRFGASLRVPRRNASPAPEGHALRSIPREVVDEVERLCQWDTQIYDRARRLFAQ